MHSAVGSVGEKSTILGMIRVGGQDLDSESASVTADLVVESRNSSHTSSAGNCYTKRHMEGLPLLVSTSHWNCTLWVRMQSPCENDPRVCLKL